MLVPRSTLLALAKLSELLPHVLQIPPVVAARGVTSTGMSLPSTAYLLMLQIHTTTAGGQEPSIAGHRAERVCVTCVQPARVCPVVQSGCASGALGALIGLSPAGVRDEHELFHTGEPLNLIDTLQPLADVVIRVLGALERGTERVDKSRPRSRVP